MGAFFAQGGIELDNPKRSFVALSGAAVAVSVTAGLKRGCFGQGDFTFSAPAISFGAAKNIFSSFDSMCTSFDSRHNFSF